MKSSLHLGLAFVALVASLSACTSILGSFDYATGTGGGSSTTTSGTTTTATMTGTGGMMTCTPCSAADNCTAPNDCTEAACTGGCCSGTPLPLDTKCTSNGGAHCDGKGKCVACIVSAECTQPTTSCQQATCTDGVCGTMNVASGMTCSDNGGKFCDGNGNCAACLQTSDCSGVASKQCAPVSCLNGACTAVDATPGTKCTAGGTVCDGNGACVPCLQTSDCAKSTTTCAVVSCASKMCMTADEPKGMTCNDSGGVVCDGKGNCTSAHCTDGVQDGDETDVDCGGSCPACANTLHCKLVTDCLSGYCVGTPIGVCTPCATDLMCPSGDFCDTTNNGGTCTPTKATAQPCGGTDQCTSGFCVDGVCCNSACTGNCNGCTMALTGMPDGTCAPYTAGTAAPSGQCPTSMSAPCGNDGRCGAAGACEQAKSGTACGVTCANGMETMEACNGSGTCAPGSPTACPNNLECASGTSCLSSCAGDTNCASGFWCSSGVCVPKSSTGSACTAGDQCTSTFCVDGFCCGSSCTGACQACSAALTGGTNGTCAGVSSGPDPRNVCTTTAQTSCGTNGTCTAGACADWPSGTVCTNVCTAGSQTTAACNGTGTCVAGAQKACSPYLCGAGACKTSCVTHADCIAGDFCWNGACTKASSIVSGEGAFAVYAMVSGGLQAWGYDNDGELGNGTTGTSSTPVAVSSLSGVTAYSAGDIHACAVVGGGLQCWGGSNHGQLGTAPASMCSGYPCSLLPIPVPGFSSGVTAVGLGGYHTCAVKGGGLMCWGDNDEGQLGNNSQTDSPIPVQVSGLTSGVAAVAGGEHHTCALTTAGAVMCWGWNSYGQAGANPPYAVLVPQPVSGLSSGVTALSAGQAHTCALTNAGAVKCWGRNQNGQLGNGTTTDTDASAPVQVTGLTSGVVAIAAGFAHTCAVLSTGSVECWGWDSSGEIGPNASTCSPVTNPPQCTTPVAVPGISGATAVAAGFEFTCALTSTGPQCWGNNGSGSLGNGGTTNSATPVPVMEP